MNAATLGGIFRAILAALAGFAAGKGIDITGLATPEVTGALATTVVAIWSVFTNKKKSS